MNHRLKSSLLIGAGLSVSWMVIVLVGGAYDPRSIEGISDFLANALFVFIVLSSLTFIAKIIWYYIRRDRFYEYQQKRNNDLRIIQSQVSVEPSKNIKQEERIALSKVSDIKKHDITHNGEKIELSNPLYGVKGWLRFFVIMRMYVAPMLFVLLNIISWNAIIETADIYSGIIIVGMIESVIGAFFIVKWILIAKSLRDLRPGIVQETMSWLKITLGWGILITPLIFMVGMPSYEVMPNAIPGIVLSLISFSIWYSYFNVSKRVKATYPDWKTCKNEEQANKLYTSAVQFEAWGQVDEAIEVYEKILAQLPQTDGAKSAEINIKLLRD